MNEYYEELFATRVGSHAFKMNRPDSDTDIFKCYIAPSSGFLIGKQHKGSHFNQSNNVDTTSTEIGIVVNQLLKNNVNYLINVMSPLIISYSKELRELQVLTQKNLSKQCFDSVYGLAYHNYRRYIVSGKQNTEKKRKIIARTILFGQHLLLYHTFIFEFALCDVTPSDLDDMLYDLKCTYENSTLPETPQHKEEMYDWLLNLRINKLKKEVDLND